MKKFKLVAFIILCVFFLQILMPILIDINWNNVFAEDINTWDVSENGDGTVIATLSDDGTLNISGNGKMKNYGNELIDYQKKRDNIKRVVINKGVTSIGKSAFNSCTSLSSIAIPESVTSIGESAFYYCTSLSSIKIPEGATSIGSRVFEYCTSLSSINVSSDNKNYTSDNGVLYTKDKTKLITYPAGKEDTEYTILEGVTSIGDYAFYDCESLSSISIPEGVTSIGWQAFGLCESLSSISIPEGVTSIGESAFSICTSLNSITIPESVISIGKSAFSSCTSLSSISIPEGVTSIGWQAFGLCKSLSSINVSGDNKNYTSDNGVLYTKDRTKIIKYPEGKVGTEYTILEGVTSIEDCAFDDCTSLSSITIPEGVTSIGNFAFCNCESLSSITIPEGVTSIGWHAFESCQSLSSITIPEGVTSIGDSAFSSCTSLNSITIPESVTSIGYRAFCDCTSLSSITIPESVTKIQERAFVNCSQNLTIYCKKDSYAKKYAEEQKIRYILIEFKDYETIINRNEKYLTKINANTTISQLKEKIQTNGTVKILKGENEVTDSNTYVGTGMIIQVETEKYIAVVKGDLNGDGKIGLSDFTNIKFGLIGKKQLNTASQLAGDINGDGKMSLSDMTKLKMYLLGKVSI